MLQPQQVYGWELPERPIFVRWFEDAEGARSPGLRSSITSSQHRGMGCKVQSELLHQGLVEAGVFDESGHLLCTVLLCCRPK